MEKISVKLFRSWGQWFRKMLKFFVIFLALMAIC